MKLVTVNDYTIAITMTKSMFENFKKNTQYKDD